MKTKLILITVLLTMIITLSGCYTVPIIGRTTFNFVSLEEEQALGLNAFLDAKKQTPLSNNEELNNRVKEIGSKLAESSHYPEWDWEFIVFDQPDIPNAWCLPGGKVAVYSGLFPYIKSDDELATVIAHEIAHAVARHGAERMSHNYIKEIGASIVAGAAGEEYAEVASTVYGVSSQYFVMLPYSRKHEYEADKIGLMYMSKAGYKPEAAVTFWSKFSQENEGQAIPEFFSTHPSDANRIENIKALIPEAIEYRNLDE